MRVEPEVEPQGLLHRGKYDLGSGSSFRAVVGVKFGFQATRRGPRLPDVVRARA